MTIDFGPGEGFPPPASSPVFPTDGVGTAIGSGEDLLVQAPPGKTPIALFVGAVGLALVGGASGLLLKSPILLGVAWLLAGPAAVWLLGRFAAKDQAARSRPIYDGVGWANQAQLIAGVVILLAIAIVAFGIGRWAAYNVGTA